MSSQTDAAPTDAPTAEPASSAANAGGPPVSTFDPFDRARERAGATSWQPSIAPEPATAAEPARRGGTGFLTVLLMSVLAASGGAIGGAALVSQPQLLAPLGLTLPGARTGTTEPQRLAAVEADLATLRERLGRLEARVPAGPPATQIPGAAVPPAPVPGTIPDVAPTVPPVAGVAPDLAPVRQELAGLGGRLTAMETRLAALDPTGAGGAVIAGLQADVAQLKVLVAQLQAQAAATPSAGMTLAVLSLVEAANGPGPFVPEFEAARATLPATPELAALEPLARSGAPTRTQLEQRFATLAPAVSQMQAQSESGGGIGGWFQRLFASMVRVERADAASGTGPAAALARAQQRLDEGDLAGALREADTITPAPDAVRAWTTGARARLDLEARIAAVRGAVQRPAAPASAPAATPAIAPAAPVPAPQTAPIAPQPQTAPTLPTGAGR